MEKHIWTDVDRFFEETLLAEDPRLEKVLTNSDAAGLPAHNVSPCQGQLLQILTMMARARRVLEIGTLGGYSTIWLARALPAGGIVMTIEAVAHHAATARANWKLADVQDRIQLLEGDAREMLARLIAQKTEPFDLIFIDADKPSNPAYLELALQLARPGTVIIGDNVVREGMVAAQQSTDPKVIGVQTYCRALGPAGLLSTGIQTVGRKGYDGFAISIVRHRARSFRE